MFNRIVKSPQAILAESIASALGEYFVIDPTKIETSLLQNACIRLSNVELQPISNRPIYPLTSTSSSSSTEDDKDDDYVVVMDISGTVKIANFYWNWGSSHKEGGSKFVNSAKLELSGSEFCISLKKVQRRALLVGQDLQEQGQETSDPSSSNPSASTSKTGFAKYVQDQVDRIIDTLTLSIEDFQFQLKIVDDEGFSSSSCSNNYMMFGGNSITLNSHGRESIEGPLKQTLNLEGLFVSIVKPLDIEESITTAEDENSSSSDTDTKRNSISLFPLLSPFSYEASCTRISGKRFQSGIMTGVTIQGCDGSQEQELDADSSSSIILHAGKNQLKFLNTLGGYLWKENSINSDNDGDEEPNESSLGEDDCNTDNAAAEEQEESLSSSSSPTVMKVPLQGLTIVLPNDSKISVQGLLFQYIFDGSWQKLSGYDGYTINDNSDEKLVDLPDDNKSCWEIDFVENHFTICSNDDKQHNEEEEEGAVVAKIRAYQSEIQLVQYGMIEFVSILQGMTKEDTGAAHEILTSSRSLQLPPSSLDASSSKSKGEGSHNKRETREDDIARTMESSSSSSASSWTVDLVGTVDCCFLDTNNDVVVDCQFHNAHADTSTMTFSLESIDQMVFPGTIQLREPIQNTKVIFDGKLLNLTMGDVVATLLEPPESQKPGTDDEEIEKMKEDQKIQHQQLETKASSLSTSRESDSGNNDETEFAIPFSATTSIRSITVYQIDNETLHTSVKSFDAAFGPDITIDKKTGTMIPTGAIRALLVVEEFNHRMIQAVDPKVTAVIRLNHLDKVEAFDFSATNIGVAAGYSILSWKRLFETGDQNRNKKEASPNDRSHNEKDKQNMYTKLPFARVRPLKVHIAVKSEDLNLIGTEGSTLHFKEFRGNEKCTSETLMNFYTTGMISNVPGVVANANILGMDVGDTAAGQIGVATTAGTLSAAGLGGAASPVAGVLGKLKSRYCLGF